MDKPQHPRDRILTLIAIFKYVKAVILFAAGIDAFYMIHRDIGTVISHAADMMHLDIENRIIRHILERALSLTGAKLRLIGEATIAYGALFTVEGTGLMMRKRWAEYLTAIITASFIPLEIYEAVVHFSFLKVITIILNTVIVWYLIWKLRHPDVAAAQ